MKKFEFFQDEVSALSALVGDFFGKICTLNITGADMPVVNDNGEEEVIRPANISVEGENGSVCQRIISLGINPEAGEMKVKFDLGHFLFAAGAISSPDGRTFMDIPEEGDLESCIILHSESYSCRYPVPVYTGEGDEGIQVLQFPSGGTVVDIKIASLLSLWRCLSSFNRDSLSLVITPTGGFGYNYGGDATAAYEGIGVSVLETDDTENFDETEDGFAIKADRNVGFIIPADVMRLITSAELFADDFVRLTFKGGIVGAMSKRCKLVSILVCENPVPGWVQLKGIMPKDPKRNLFSIRVDAANTCEIVANLERQSSMLQTEDTGVINVTVDRVGDRYSCSFGVKGQDCSVELPLADVRSRVPQLDDDGNVIKDGENIVYQAVDGDYFPFWGNILNSCLRSMALDKRFIIEIYRGAQGGGHFMFVRPYRDKNGKPDISVTGCVIAGFRK